MGDQRIMPLEDTGKTEFPRESMNEEPPEYVLETERLLFRRMLRCDVEILHEIMSDSEAMAYWSCAPHTDISQTMRFFEESVTAPPHCFDLSICLKPAVSSFPSELPRFIGKIGIWDGEIGFILHPSIWRKGIASEAMGVFLEYFWSISEVQVLKADVDPRNDASLRLLKRYGFVETGRAEKTYETHLGWCDSIYFSLEKPVASCGI